jgi:hydroxymethylbilane synthase
MTALRAATRGSALARWQTDHVAALLGGGVEAIVVSTEGDRRTDVPIEQIGGRGVFVKEVQAAVLEGRADVAVHSAKDLPSVPHEALVIGAFMTRRDAADALVGRPLRALAQGATIASGSVRRRAQLAAVRPDLTFVELRGNIATRLSKVPDGGSIVMAVAALQVLGQTDLITERLDPGMFVPAVGQGCVAVEARAHDAATAELLAAVDDAVTRHEVEVERSFLAELGSGCSLPVGAHVAGPTLHTFLAATDDINGADRVGVARDTVLLSFDGSDHEAARRAARAARDAVGW